MSDTNHPDIVYATLCVLFPPFYLCAVFSATTKEAPTCRLREAAYFLSLQISTPTLLDSREDMWVIREASCLSYACNDMLTSYTTAYTVPCGVSSYP